MADLKISQLPAATTPLAGSEVVPLVQSGTTKKVAVNRMVIGPSFSAYQSSAQAIASAFTPTKVQLQTEQWDTNAAFDSGVNYRFTPQVPGYYNVAAHVGVYASSFITVSLYKNSNLFKILFNSYPTAWGDGGASALVYLNGSTDYIELYVTTGAALNLVASEYYTWFQASLARSA